MTNRILIADGKLASVGDTVYIVVSNTTPIDGIFYGIIGAETPKKYYAKQMVVDSFDSIRMYLKEPGCKSAGSVESGRVNLDLKSAMFNALQYQIAEMDKHEKLFIASREMVDDLKKEINNL